MTRDQLRQAIEGPVAVGGAKIASRLVQSLLNDVGDNPDHLPILQHALMRTWNRWLDNRTEALDLPHYDAIGRMAIALSQHADEAYAELPDPRSGQLRKSSSNRSPIKHGQSGRPATDSSRRTLCRGFSYGNRGHYSHRDISPTRAALF